MDSFWPHYGVHSEYGGEYTATILAGMSIHLVTAISIGIAVGIFLYKTGILNISKPSNGLLYGLFTGSVAFFVFYLLSSSLYGRQRQ